MVSEIRTYFPVGLIFTSVRLSVCSCNITCYRGLQYDENKLHQKPETQENVWLSQSSRKEWRRFNGPLAAFLRSPNLRTFGLIHVPSLSFPVSPAVPTVRLVLYVILLMRTLPRRLVMLVVANSSAGVVLMMFTATGVLQLKASFDSACYGLYCIFQLRLSHKIFYKAW